ncbi:HDOD domain-containing protein [Myxococcota bacterium]|nr:HDOD domain-containing protein [Myxococcota bacterium]
MAIEYIDEKETSLIDPLEIQREVLAYFRSKTYQPPLLPLISVEIMVLSQQNKCKFEDILNIVEQDPLLTARILERAYARSGNQKFTLENALIFLGMDKLQQFIFELSLDAKIFQSQYTEAMERLRVHSLTTAFIAKRIASLLNLDEQDAFLAGLLHDVGTAGLFIVLSENYKNLNIFDTWPLIVEIHHEISAALAKQWRFPKDFQVLLMDHHQPKTKMGFVLSISERFAFEFAPIIGSDPSTNDHPQKVPGKDISKSEVIREACEKLRIDQKKWSQLRADSLRIIEQIFP